MLQQRATQPGVPPLSPHDLRRSFVNDMYKLRTSERRRSTVSQLGGFVRPEMFNPDMESKLEMR